MLKVRYLIVHYLLFLLSCNKRKEEKEGYASMMFSRLIIRASSSAFGLSKTFKAAMKKLKNNCIPLKSVNSQGKQFISY